MRYAYGFLASAILFASPAIAAPVEFAIDLTFGQLPDAPVSAVGTVRDAGRLHFDSSLLLASGESIVVFDQLSSFQLSIPLTDRQTGAVTTFSFGLDGLQGGVCVDVAQCGIRFSDGGFNGFFGRYFDGFLGDPPFLATQQEGDILLLDGRTIFADGQVSLRAAPVPEPSSWAITALGALAVGWACRRRRVSNGR